ncbi:hypothetical protein WKI71_27140 [Streptomyces sp. MS1.AVA.1]|uniref:Uncharacterized protein n=1 Tax=Streptomyces machairae TaxID=3134109 RepID=A0ABU8UPF0_9ACTN
MGKEGDRRSHVLVTGERDQGIGLRWPFDQHDPRLRRVQRRPHRPRRPGPVMPYAEQQRPDTAPLAAGPVHASHTVPLGPQLSDDAAAHTAAYADHTPAPSSRRISSPLTATCPARPWPPDDAADRTRRAPPVGPRPAATPTIPSP